MSSVPGFPLSCWLGGPHNNKLKPPMGKPGPLPTTCTPSGQQIMQFFISSGSVSWSQRSRSLVGPVRVREMTQPLTALNTIAFKTIKLRVCYATTANGYNCHNSKVIFCLQIVISSRVFSPEDCAGCMPQSEFIQQCVTDVAIACFPPHPPTAPPTPVTNS